MARSFRWSAQPPRWISLKAMPSAPCDGMAHAGGRSAKHLKSLYLSAFFAGGGARDRLGRRRGTLIGRWSRRENRRLLSTPRPAIFAPCADG